MTVEIDASVNAELAAGLVAGAIDHSSGVDLSTCMFTDIGGRLKLIRERNGLSQRELAKRAGITNSNISMIEQGLVSPSINSLAKVLHGIPMTLAQFFACDQVDVGQMVYPAEQLESSQRLCPNGAIIQSIGTEKSHRKIDMGQQVFPSGCDTGVEPLRCKTELAGLVVSGYIELTAGMQVHELSQGDAFYLAAHQPYRIRNRKEVVAVIVSAGLHE